VRNKSYLLVTILIAGCIARAQDYPRIESFFGYTYMRANSATDVPAFSANGGSTQFVVNANRWLGFVADLGAVHNGNINNHNLDSTFTNFLFGPRVTLRYSRISPYFNVLFGGMHAGSSVGTSALPVASTLPVYLPGVPDPVTGQAVTLRAVAAQTAFAMTAGGGLDIKINRHVSFRPIGLDYMLTRLQNLRSAEDNNQHNIRYTTGFNFTFGGEAPAPPPPAPPPTHACWDGSTLPVGTECPKRDMNLRLTANRMEVCAGSSITITPSVTPPPGAALQWSIGGEPVSQANSLEFGATGRTPGSYKVGLRATADGYNDVTAETAITVNDYRPPTGTLEVSPAEVWAGEKATLTARFTGGQCGGNTGEPVIRASEGSISGNQFDSSEVKFDPGSSAEQRKTVTLVASVTDEKGSATAQAALVVKKAAETAARRFPDIVFPAGSARVNNCGKRVLLEDLKSVLEGAPTGKVIFVGHVSEKETGKAGLDQQRALNAAAVLSAGTGICYGFPVSQIQVGAAGSADNGVDYQSHFCGTTQEIPGSIVKESENDAKFRRVEVWFVPPGGALPKSLNAYKDTAPLGVSGLGCPK
jgi:hypothetical protein